MILIKISQIQSMGFEALRRVKIPGGLVPHFARLRSFVADRCRTRALAAMGLMFVMPFLLVGSCNMITISGLGGLGGDLLRDNPVLAHMSEAERTRYARTLADLLESDPENFLKLVAADLEILLEKPGLQRADGPIEVWQYRSTGCVLDVYMRAEEGRETKRVVDYEVRMRQKARLDGDFTNTDIDSTACFQSVLAAHAPQGRPVKLARLF